MEETKESYTIPNGKRCKDKAYVVLVGMSGAGKSTTMNMLFDRSESSRHEDEFLSSTQEISEYEIKVPTEDEKLPDQMIVIDTPGFHDTLARDFKAKDASIMATLEEFLSNHTDLRDCFPTAVLLVADFCDKTLTEERSYFIQFLSAIESLIKNYTLVDTGSATCNLVLVLTHFMKAKEEDIKNPEIKIRTFLGLIKTFTTIPSDIPVVIAENKGVEYGLEQESGYSLLPNGEHYPFNLFRAIRNVAKKCKDRAGEILISNAFRDPLRLRKATIATNALLTMTNKDCQRFLHILQAERFTKIKETFITRRLQTQWDTLPVSLREGRGISLHITKAIFSRQNIRDDNDIPKLPAEVLLLLQQLPINDALERVLRNIGLAFPQLERNTKSAGYFYNLLSDTISNVTPFDVTDLKLTQSGFSAPSFLQVDLVSNTNDKVFVWAHNHNTIENYASHRMETFQLPYMTTNAQYFCNSLPLPGNNMFALIGFHEERPRFNPDEVTGIKEFREYLVNLTDKLVWNKKYITSLNELNKFKPKKIEGWTKLIDSFGTHLVKFGYLGGSIILRATRDKTKNNFSPPANVLKAIQDILENIDEPTCSQPKRTPVGWKLALEYSGGDPNITPPEYEIAFSSSARSDIHTWIKSLRFHPKLLFSEIHLAHISEVLEKAGHYKISEQVSLAIEKCKGIPLYISENKPVERSKTKKCNIS